MEIIPISPESLEIANAYLTHGSLIAAANSLNVSPDRVATILEKKEVRSYIDQVFLDQGYRNRSKLADLLDRVIESKLEEAEETGMYSNKDLADLIDMAHKHRVAEIKLQKDREVAPKQQTNVQINNPFGEGNYGNLIAKLFECPND